MCKINDDLPSAHSSDTLVGMILQSIADADEGKCRGNGDCQDCPKAKWSCSSLFTEEPRIIGCMEDDAK